MGNAGQIMKFKVIFKKFQQLFDNFFAVKSAAPIILLLVSGPTYMYQA